MARFDALVALLTFVVTLLVGPERGILAGVAAAALCYPWRAGRVPVRERLWRPSAAPELDPAATKLGRLAGRAFAELKKRRAKEP